MNQKKNKQLNNAIIFDFDSSTTFLTIPDALISYTRDTVFSVWQTLERQLSKVDPVTDPDIYRALDDRAETLFNSWLQFRRVN